MGKPKTNYSPGPQDCMQTPPHAIEPLLKYIDAYIDVKREPGTHGGHDMFRPFVIWEPFAGEGLLVNALEDYGFHVFYGDIQTGQDFFHYTPDKHWDMLISNPPFSLKYAVLERCFSLKKRFALLVPYETTYAKEFQRMFHHYNNEPWRIEVLSPERRISFKTPKYGWGMKVWDEKRQKMIMRGDSAQMPTCWITWGLAIEEQTESEPLKTFYVPMRKVKYDKNDREILDARD